jgi:hypothetical protein
VGRSYIAVTMYLVEGKGEEVVYPPVQSWGGMNGAKKLVMFSRSVLQGGNGERRKFYISLATVD